MTRKKPYRPIIKSTHNVPWIIRLRDIILTILVWLLYFYFMYQTFGFVRALVGQGDGSATFTRLLVDYGVIDMISSYLMIMLIIMVIFTAWSLYNTIRYGSRTRRRHSAPITPEQLAAVHMLPAKQIKNWQRARIMVMHHDKNGRLTEVRTQKK